MSTSTSETSSSSPDVEEVPRSEFTTVDEDDEPNYQAEYPLILCGKCGSVLNFLADTCECIDGSDVAPAA
ncbi:hypothetical protein FZEAL_4950 [Fusarium zealandicum]|uniref:Uncharacterized protein n=1 Tax=Fusarium zealandicum TaxID=1053134 RepID=A0A8H4UKQ6_9HYPO|nr:hypothetical protein FZEAL_4950 [Fusarium zealandicum]